MDVSPETLRVTALGRADAGPPVNLERPLRADARLGGHFVQGHVDAAGARRGDRDEGEFLPPPHRLSGRSAPLDDPEGLGRGRRHQPDHRRPRRRVGSTSRSSRTPGRTPPCRRPAVGDAVNLECDLMGKYVVRLASSTPRPAAADLMTKHRRRSARPSRARRREAGRAKLPDREGRRRPPPARRSRRSRRR